MLAFVRVCSLLFATAAFAADPAELADNAVCKSLGVFPLTPYRHGLALNNTYGASNSTPMFMPYYSSEPLGASSASTAVIYIHGLLGNANDYFCEGLEASQAHAGVLVLAPWFGNEASSASYWGDASGGLGVTPFWSNSRWSTGGTNTAPPKGFTTSFDMLDALLRALPRSVTLVTLAGFSAGAQLTGRYAFATPLGSPLDSFAPHVRFIVGSPGSYMYLSSTRPAPSCRPLHDTGPQHECAVFAVPSAAECPPYDDYKYGLQGMDYLNLYLAPLASNASAQKEAVARFATKDVRLFLGTEDVCNCNAQGFELPVGGVCTPEEGSLTCSPDDFGGKGCCDTYPDARDANSLDYSCAGMLQGSNRLQRGLNFASHLQTLFPSYKPLVYTDRYGHNSSAMYDSAAFQQVAFDL